MASLSTLNDEILLSLNREIIVINPLEETVLRTITLPKAVAPKPAAVAGKEIAPSDNGDNIAECAADDEDAQPVPVIGQNSNRIIHTAVSPNAQRLAVATADEKALYLYRLQDDGSTFEMLSRRDLSRTSNALRFSGDSKLLFVADKTGDCFTYECGDESCETPAKWILAHFSMVLDIWPSACEQFILTCDRDEKIRCTNFPKCTLIESYCLGHTEYVAAIALLPTHLDSTLISVSGDKTIRVWQYKSGTQLASFALPAPALRMAVRKSSAHENHVAVTLFDADGADLVIYACKTDQETGEFAFTAIGEHLFDGIKEISSIVFDAHGRLWLCAVTTENTVQVIRLSANSSSSAYTVDDGHKLAARIQQAATSVQVHFDAEEIGLLFKKKFDNIHDYQERKKRRIEEKNKTKSI